MGAYFMAKLNDLRSISTSAPMIIMIVIVIAVFLFTMLMQTQGGPIMDEVGVIQSFTRARAAGVTAFVRLNDNTIIKANVVTGSGVQQGQIAYIHVFQSIFVKARTYEVYRTDPSRQ